ncbi:hypothetical protein WKV44_00585 [Spirochaetia bacterium 38H-sp]|uniref:Uncharacterized protein n=1 Tax=Rarispira pelagica TaxID=3141764 RepID=A0ABU9U8P1_9SPIR
MKKVFLSVIFFLLVFPVFSKELRVAVMPFDTDVREPQAKAIVSSLKNAISLDLMLLKDVIPIEIKKGEDTDVKKIIEEKNPDRLLYTAFSNGSEGYVISFTLINTDDGKVLNNIESNISRLDSPFEQLETAVTSLIKAISAEQVEMGRVSVQNLGERGKYNLVINNVELGEVSGIIAPVISGTYDWRVEQFRFGKQVIIEKGKITVSRGADSVISFSVPVLTDEEKSYIADIKEKAVSAAISGDERGLRELAAEWKAMFSDVSFSPSLVVYRGQEKGFLLLLEPGKLKKYIEDTALSPDPFVPERIGKLLSEVPPDTPYTSLLMDTLFSCGEEYLLINVYHALRLFELYRPGEALGRLKALRPVLVYVSESWQLWYERLVFFIEKSDSRHRERMVSSLDFILPVSEVLIALGLDAAAVYFWLNDNSQELKAQADALYPSYLAETDPAAAEKLHRQISELYSQANRITFFKWGSTFAGGVLSVFAPINLFSVASAPQLELWRDISVIFPQEVEGMQRMFSLSPSRIAEWFPYHYRDFKAYLISR